jgi:hypothetical protein
MIRGTCKVGDIVWIGHEHAPSFKRWKLRWECPAGLFLGLSPDGKCRVRLAHETRDMPLDAMYNYEQLAYESVQRAEAYLQIDPVAVPLPALHPNARNEDELTKILATEIGRSMIPKSRQLDHIGVFKAREAHENSKS